MLSDGDYDTAAELLQQRFGHPQQIISAHMKELLKCLAMPAVSTHQKAEDLRDGL